MNNNFQNYIVWADEILAIAAQILAGSRGSAPSAITDALDAAHELVTHHVANLAAARASADSAD